MLQIYRRLVRIFSIKWRYILFFGFNEYNAASNQTYVHNKEKMWDNDFYLYYTLTLMNFLGCLSGDKEFVLPIVKLRSLGCAVGLLLKFDLCSDVNILNQMPFGRLDFFANSLLRF